MASLKDVFLKLGWDGWTFSLCGIAAIIISVLDFLQLINLDSGNAIKIVLLACGLLMAAMAALSSRRSADIAELQNSIHEWLGAAHIEQVRDGRDFHAHARQSISHAKKYIVDTTLNSTEADIVHPVEALGSYYNLLYERLKKGEIAYNRVEIIYNKKRLESVIARLITHRGMEYLIRYIESPPSLIPMINVMSVDGDNYYLAGIKTSINTSDVLFVKSSEFSMFFDNYWNELWYSAKPLNSRDEIDWEEINKIATRINVKPDEVKEMRAKWENKANMLSSAKNTKMLGA